MSPRKLFEQELEELRQDVLQMAEWVQDGYDCLFAALEKKDGDQMRRYVRHDRTIEDMQRNIESQCLSLLTRQTPVARDLRTVSAALKVVTDLERIGNHLSDMAELFVRIGPAGAFQIFVCLSGYGPGDQASLGRPPERLWSGIWPWDRRPLMPTMVLTISLTGSRMPLVKELKKDGSDADGCVDALMTAKYLEKIGDHGVNIGQWEIFQETGEIDEIRLL